MQGIHALRRHAGKRTALVAAAGLALTAAAPASAQVVEGQRADPAGDQVVTPAGAPAGLDLSGAAVRYDSAAGELRITYRGAITIGSHSRTTYDGVISQASSRSGCAIVARGDATFSGSTSDVSGGGDPRGAGRLDVKDVGPIDGVVLLPGDGSVVFAFTSPLLKSLSFRCAGALHAEWINSNPFTSADEVAPFDLEAAPEPGPGTGVASVSSVSVSAVATGGASPVRRRSPRATVLVVSGGLTARVAPARGGLRGLLGPGLVIPVRCSAGCEVRGRVTSGGVVVARASVARLVGGRAVLRLRADDAARWSLVHRASAPVTIAVTVAGGDGGASRTLVHRALLR